MAVNLKPPETLLPVPGVRLGTAAAGIRKADRDDLLVIELAEGTQAAGVFTQNAFAAPPVQLCRERLARGATIHGLLVNAGNANAGTGARGAADARTSTAALAASLDCAPEVVLPFSTGVIGEPLPMDRLLHGIPQAVASLSGDGWLAAARAIMTTDTQPKGCSRRVATASGDVTVTGIVKGVGMIQPDMATLLAFVGTDAHLSADAVRECLAAAVGPSFNSITVDGDTSTNDSCMLFATGAIGGPALAAGPDLDAVRDAITEVCTDLARLVVRDGEGATKFVTLEVGGARNPDEARRAGYAIANSPLVKTALFAGDANWGRLVMAIGNAGLDGLDPATVSVRLDHVPLLEQGEPHPDYREADGAAVLARPEFTIAVDLGRGRASARLWTCDLSYEYVKINAEYRT